MLLHFPIWMKRAHSSRPLFFVNWWYSLGWGVIPHFFRYDIRGRHDICDTMWPMFMYFVELPAILVVSSGGGPVSDLNELTLLAFEELCEMLHLPTLLQVGLHQANYCWGLILKVKSGIAQVFLRIKCFSVICWTNIINRLPLFWFNLEKLTVY